MKRPLRCTHHDCQAARAAELAAISDRTGNPRYLADAVAVHDRTVNCRRAPLIERDDSPCLEDGRDNCNDSGTGEGRYHGRI